MRVYLDNMAVSGRVVGDLEPLEMEAVRRIDAAHEAGKLKRVTSRQSWREQDRTKDAGKRGALERARDQVSVVATDHALLGFNNLEGPYGTVAVNPMITDIVDEPLFSDLKALGLKDGDAKHLMYAVTNTCERFVTTDPDFLTRRAALEARCASIRILKPTELVAELGLPAA